MLLASCCCVRWLWLDWDHAARWKCWCCSWFITSTWGTTWQLVSMLTSIENSKRRCHRHDVKTVIHSLSGESLQSFFTVRNKNEQSLSFGPLVGQKRQFGDITFDYEELWWISLTFSRQNDESIIKILVSCSSTTLLPQQLHGDSLGEAHSNTPQYEKGGQAG